MTGANMPVRLEDSAIVDGCRYGDDGAVRLFLRQYGPLVAGCLRRARVPDADLPDVQELVLTTAVCELRAGRFNGTASLWTWVRSIAAHKVADYWRKNGHTRGHVVSIEDLADRRDLTSRDLDPDWRMQLREAIDALDSRHRRAFAWCVLGRLPVTDLARALHVTVGRARDIVTASKRRVLAALGHTHTHLMTGGPAVEEAVPHRLYSSGTPVRHTTACQ